MKNVKLFVLAILLFSCNQPKEKTFVQQDSFITIPVESDWEIASGIKLSKFVTNIQFIPLESTDECLLRGVDRAEVTDEYIYVVDKPTHRSPCVYQFDLKGHFIRQIGSKGQGPEEFIEMRGFALNRETGEIYIYDGVRKRMLSFYPDGSFARIIKLTRDCDNFEFQNGLFYLYDPYGEDKTAKKIIVSNIEGDEQAQYLDNANADLDVVFGSSRVVKTSENEVLFYEAFNDTVYAFDKENMKVKYVFDFGEYAMPQNRKREYMEAVAQNKSRKYRSQLLGDYIRNASDIWESKQWLFFNVVKNSLLYKGLYNKQTKKVSIQSSFEDDLYVATGIGEEFVGTTPKGLIACVNANQIKNVFEKYLLQDVRKGKLSASRLDSLTTFFSQYIPINEKLQERNMSNTKVQTPKTLSDVLDDMYGSDGNELNPMLMIIDFKE